MASFGVRSALGIILLFLAATLPSFAQITVQLSPGTNGTTSPIAPAVVGQGTSFTTTVSFRVTNNTQTQQVVRVETLIQNAQTGAMIASGISNEKVIPAGQTQTVEVTVVAAPAGNEAATGRKDATTRANVRQGATIIHPESWGFTYDVASSESGGGNYYQQ